MQWYALQYMLWYTLQYINTYNMISYCSILFPILSGWYLVGDRSISILSFAARLAVNCKASHFELLGRIALGRTITMAWLKWGYIGVMLPCLRKYHSYIIIFIVIIIIMNLFGLLFNTQYGHPKWIGTKSGCLRVVFHNKGNGLTHEALADQLGGRSWKVIIRLSLNQPGARKAGAN